MGKAGNIKWAKVKLDKRMEELGLDKFFREELWPPMAAVRKLATRVRECSKLNPDRKSVPFVFVDLAE